MSEYNVEIDDHLSIKDRGDERAAPDSGLSFYVDDGKLKAVDPDGNRTVPVESFSVEEQSIGQATTISEGDDLAQEILDALADGHTTINVTPHEDGTEWDWATDVTIDPTEYTAGFEINISDHARINYQNSGTALTVDAQGDLASQLDNDGTGASVVEIAGGQWDLSDGGNWLHLIDIYRPEIEPREVVGDGTATYTAIHLENDGTWSEGGYISGRVSNFGVGLDTTAAADPNESFSDYRIEDFFIGKIRDYGMRLEGGWVGCRINHAVGFAAQDDVTGFYLDGDFLESHFSNLNFEDGSDSHTGLTWIETGPNYRWPAVINNSHTYVDQEIQRANADDVVIRLKSSADIFRVGDMGGQVFEIDHNNDKFVFKNGNEDVVAEKDANGNWRFNGATLYEIGTLKLDTFPYLLNLTGRTSDPGAAASGQVDMWYRSDQGEIKATNDNGDVVTLASFP